MSRLRARLREANAEITRLEDLVKFAEAMNEESSKIINRLMNDNSSLREQVMYVQGRVHDVEAERDHYKKLLQKLVS